MWKQITTVGVGSKPMFSCVQRTSGLNVKANHNAYTALLEYFRLCSKNVRIKCESKSQLPVQQYWAKYRCVQRTSGLNVKANHNFSIFYHCVARLCSKNVRIKCESKSQRWHGTANARRRCVQRTSGLNVKASRLLGVYNLLQEWISSVAQK